MIAVIFVLLASTAVIVVASEPVDRDVTDTLPTSPFLVYPIGNAENETACPVYGNEKSAILQAPSVEGSFSTLGLNSSLFQLRQIMLMCRPTSNYLGTKCDLLSIEFIRNPDRRGSFNVRHVSSSGTIIDVIISYGPEGITLIQDALPPSPDDSIIITSTGIQFELRTSQRIDDPVATVCESIDGGDYSQSSQLSARSNRRDPNCIQALEGGGFSVPFIVKVTPVSEATEITPRLIKITFGVCNATNLLVSEPLHVTGLIDEITTSDTLSGTPSLQETTVTTTTITATDDDADHRTTQSPAATSTREITGSNKPSATTTATTITSSPTTVPAPVLAKFGRTIIIIIACVVGPVLIVVIVAMIIAIILFRYKRTSSADFEKQNKKDVDIVDAGKDTDLTKVSPLVSPLEGSNSKRQGKDPGVVVSDVINCNKQSNSLSSTNEPNAAAVIRHKKPTIRPESECESEGSEVALIKDIAIANGEKIDELTSLHKLHSEVTIARLGDIHDQTKQNNASIIYTAERIDHQNITDVMD